MENTVQCIAMSLDYFAALILTLILGSCLMEKHKTPLLKIYLWMAALCWAALLCEAVSYTIRFSGYPAGDLPRTVISTVAIALGYGMAFAYTVYVSHLVGPEGTVCRRAVRALLVVGIAALVGLTVGSIFQVFFTIRGGSLIPGPLFVAAFGFDILGCLTGILLIIRYWRRLHPKDIVALLSLPTMLFVYAALQFVKIKMMYGLFLFAAVALVIIYLMIQTDRNLRAVEQEKQLVDINVAVMLSQIQPHFLCNALSAIRRVVKKDPAAAEEAIESFALYLRQNLEAMNRVEPIPFSQELKHVEEYLSLEKLRFGDRLRVEYDIAFADFLLPVLTLQPIVENAVKHGIRQGGGRVRISARREGGTVLLTVEDDGAGYAPEAMDQDQRLHIGLENVTRRLHMQCGGTVRTESQPGAGTTVVISLPLM